MYKHRRNAMWIAAIAGTLGTLAPAWGFTINDAQTLIEAGKLQEAIDLLSGEVSENPAHEAARILLAQTYEKADRREDALSAWKDLLALSNHEETKRKARMAVSRLRRQDLDKSEEAESAERTEDPLKIDMPEEIVWEGLEKIEDSKYKPPVLPPPYNWEVPPFDYETQHFTVYSTNERLSKVIGDRAEIYLAFMSKALFGGRSWAVRFPILVYASEEDYQQHGGPSGSHGVTLVEGAFGHRTGKTQVIILFQLEPERKGGRGRGRSGGKGIYKYSIESILPHELTHAVLNEFFSARKVPRWLHEAMAGRFEHTRDHYGEAARLARYVEAGEYFRMRDLFEQPSYPERIGLFYEQAAIVVLYLFEAGPEPMHAFLTELAEGRDHDAACAAALGIPEEGAVEEFERRWVEWMRQRYRKDLARSGDNPDALSVGKSENVVFRPWVNEVDTVESVSEWRDIDLSSLESFTGVGASKKDWAVDEGLLRCNAKGAEGASLLAIRMNETAPAAVTCDVKFLGNPADGNHLFGFTQLDADGNDTRVESVGPLRDNSAHKVVCLWTDDLAVYVDGVCTGRFPAFRNEGNQQYVDYPLALVAYGPMEVQNLRVGKISKFSDKPIVVASDAKNERSDPDRSRPARGDRRSRPRPPEKKEP